MGHLEGWSEDRLRQAATRYVRFAKVKAAITQLGGLLCVAAAVLTFFVKGLLWAGVVLVASPIVLSIVALPIMAALGYAMCGRDGLRAGQQMEKVVGQRRLAA